MNQNDAPRSPESWLRRMPKEVAGELGLGCAGIPHVVASCRCIMPSAGVGANGRFKVGGAYVSPLSPDC